MRLYQPARAADHIPVIDLGGSFSSDLATRKTVAWEVHKACRETGFFYVANHGVDETLVTGVFEQAKRFFELPIAEKMALHAKKSPTKAGYEEAGVQALDSQDPNAEKSPADLKEQFFAGAELPDDHADSMAHIRGYGHNQWPASLPGFREKVLAYQQGARRLGDRLLRTIALSLDMPEDTFASFYQTPGTNLRLFRYPPQPVNVMFNQLGAGAHTDWGGITLLAQDNVGGLEVQNLAGDWVEAPPIPGTFVINIGDLMARWTNDLYRSNFHRVRNVNSGNQSRYSVVMFYNPHWNSRIECMPTCTGADSPRKYPTVTAREHLDEMFQRSYGPPKTVVESA